MTAADIIARLQTLQPDAEVPIRVYRDGDYDELEIEEFVAVPQPSLVVYLED